MKATSKTSRRKEYNMKRIKNMNGYAIYQAVARDVGKYGAEEGTFYVYFSSDIRDYGLANSEPEFEGLGTLEAAEGCCTGNYAKAREIVESRTTAASFEEIAEVEAQLDAGTIDEFGDPIDAPEELNDLRRGSNKAQSLHSRQLIVQLTSEEWAGVQDAADRMGSTIQILTAFMLSIAAGQIHKPPGINGPVVLFNNGVVASNNYGTVTVANNATNSRIVVGNTTTGDISVT